MSAAIVTPAGIVQLTLLRSKLKSQQLMPDGLLTLPQLQQLAGLVFEQWEHLPSPLQDMFQRLLDAHVTCRQIQLELYHFINKGQ